jgi:anti-sigma regulatory factor (Ser/Thr protein kinase)
MHLTIRPNRRLDQSTFDNCGEWEEADDERLLVDLTNCVFVDVYAMAVLLTIVSMWCLQGDPVELRLPVRKGTRSYLARMHFFEHLPPEVTCAEDLPVVAEKPSLLLPLTPLDMASGERGIEQLAEFVEPQLPHQLAGPFIEALAEIGANVIQHAEARVGFVAAQRFEKALYRRQPPRLQLVVADAGMGIRESLRPAYPDLESGNDRDAIILALKEEVTSKPGTNSGVGLSTALAYADAFGGIFRVRSGEGVVVVGLKKPKSSARLPGFRGTVVAVELASPGRRS